MKQNLNVGRVVLLAGFASVAGCMGAGDARAGTYFRQFGDQDLCNTGTYDSDPLAGAVVAGLNPGDVSFASSSFGHGFPFAPSGGDFPGTDQIYVGQVQTGAHDGYSSAAERIAGPQSISLDLTGLIPEGEILQTITLGIAADDFQFPAFGQPFRAWIDGIEQSGLEQVLNGLDQTGPQARFFSIGLAIGSFRGISNLTLTIDQDGDGGDGWAIDFLTIGATTVPGGAAAGPVAMLGILALRRRR